MSDQKKAPSDAQIVARLRRNRGGLTAAAIGVPSNRLRGIDGVVEVGRAHTGKAGRPAILFALAENVESAAGGATDPSAESRDGSLAAA